MLLLKISFHHLHSFITSFFISILAIKLSLPLPQFTPSYSEQPLPPCISDDNSLPVNQFFPYLHIGSKGNLIKYKEKDLSMLSRQRCSFKLQLRKFLKCKERLRNTSLDVYLDLTSSQTVVLAGLHSKNQLQPVLKT